MTLSLDYARCADGLHECPRAGTCARVETADAGGVRASMWFAAMWREDRTSESDPCRFYIAIDRKDTPT